MPDPKPSSPSGPEAIPPSLARKGLAGFFLSGLLLAFPGAVLPAWGYHVAEDYLTIGGYFLAMNAGLAISIALAFYVLEAKNSSFLLALGSAIACGAFAFLAASPPAPELEWRMGGMIALGAGAGLVNRGVFHAISPLYRRDPLGTVMISGAIFGLGSVVISVLVASTFYAFGVSRILLLIALIPGLFLAAYLRSARLAQGEFEPNARGDLAAGFTSPAAILLALVLFVQFGNEWAIAGWLPLFLHKRLAINPATSVLMLALYWMALLLGRVTIATVLPRLHHGKLLGGSVLAAMFGCTVLFLTKGRFGAIAGILFIGFGFAAIYPLVVERIGGRFPSYHPGYFNGIFSFAVTGGLLAPWSLGFFAEVSGVGAIMALPLVGTLIVFLLVVLIFAEAKLHPAPRG